MAPARRRRARRAPGLGLALGLLLAPAATAATPGGEGGGGAWGGGGGGGGGAHTSNWAVIVSTSRFWFNYRHSANALSIYRTCRRLGIPDSRILLFLPDDVACNPRNAFPGRVFNHRGRGVDLVGEALEVDYRGAELTVENFLRVLTGRHRAGTPLSKRLLSDSRSNVLLYVTGHGGDEFMKFQDREQLLAQDLADAVAQMREQGRFRELLVVVETCEASTMVSKLRTPGVVALSSSEKGEKSYSHHSDAVVGVSVIDQFTFYALQFMEQLQVGSAATLADLVDFLGRQRINSTVRLRAGLLGRNPTGVKVTEFFGSALEAVPVVLVGGQPAEVAGRVEALRWELRGERSGTRGGEGGGGGGAGGALQEENAGDGGDGGCGGSPRAPAVAQFASPLPAFPSELIPAGFALLVAAALLPAVVP